MFLRILSVAGPLWIYATIALLIYGLFLQRTRFEWLALAPSAAGLLASALLLAPVHRLFFDEDIYINVASNLTRAPVNQLTVMGGPRDIQISTYPKEPAGWPVLLSLAFLPGGASENVAFWFARILFALTIAAVYHLARALLPTRRQAIIAAVLLGATHISFWYSVSAVRDDRRSYGSTWNVGHRDGQWRPCRGWSRVCGSNADGIALVSSVGLAFAKRIEKVENRECRPCAV